jgi:hypothetical protein
MKTTKERWQHIITRERLELGLNCALLARHERDRRAADVTLFVSIFAPRIVISGKNILTSSKLSKRWELMNTLMFFRLRKCIVLFATIRVNGAA